MVDASGGGGGSVGGFFYVRRTSEHHRVVHICLYPAHVAHSQLLTAPAVPSGGAVSKKSSQDTQKAALRHGFGGLLRWGLGALFCRT